MRVLIVNTSEKTGGAAVASKRLVDALNNNGIKAKMLVRDKETDDITTVELRHSPWHQWHFLWERWCVFCNLHFSHKNLFAIDIANSGTDITSLREFQEADLIHLNWVNQGMLSLSSIRHILDSGKPVVWTMHDLWPASSICHYAGECDHYQRKCGNCPLLPGGGSPHDLSYKVWKKKKAILSSRNIMFVACSRWLESQAKESSLLVGQKITSIPNAIDTHMFRPMDKAEARVRAGLPEQGKIILFVSQRVTDERKGMKYLVESVRILVEKHPEMRDDTSVAILGGHSEDLEDQLALPVYPLGYVSDERRIVDIYNSADVFVLPSLQDNLPNTIMEASACGVPCVAFNTGGIPEMISHKHTGYVAEHANADDLAAGLQWALCEADTETIKDNAVKRVAQNYSQHAVAMKYIEAYSVAMAFKRYRL